MTRDLDPHLDQAVRRSAHGRRQGLLSGSIDRILDAGRCVINLPAASTMPCTASPSGAGTAEDRKPALAALGDGPAAVGQPRDAGRAVEPGSRAFRPVASVPSAGIRRSSPLPRSPGAPP